MAAVHPLLLFVLAMMRFALAVALFAAVSVPAVAQPSAARAELVPVAIDTSLGRIVIALDRGRAPLTTANFLAYVDSGKLDGESFYRAMPYGGGGLIQGGITSDARKLGEPVAHEPVSQTGISHKAGTISMANFGPGTAKSDFFILTTDIPAFDANFAAFGHVVEGMDVVKAILASPVSPTKGEGPMKGQMLEPPVKIVKAERGLPTACLLSPPERGGEYDKWLEIQKRASCDQFNDSSKVAGAE